MEKKVKKYLSDLHYEHQLWSMEIKFFKDELKVYQNWLEEVAAKNTHEEILKQVEHFQNQFIIQKNQIRSLKNMVKAHEKRLSGFAESHQVAIDHVHFADHTAMRENMETFKKLYAELKAEFKHFLEESL